MKNSSFTLKYPERWQRVVEGVKVHEDLFERNVVSYAERWARLMEEEMADGKKLEDVYDETRQRAYDPSCGYSIVLLHIPTAGILVEVWAYGEQLRQCYATGAGEEEPTMFGGMTFRLA